VCQAPTIGTREDLRTEIFILVCSPRQCGPNCSIRKLHLSSRLVLAAVETNLIWEQDAFPHLRTCFIHSSCTGSIASEKREKGGEQKRYKRILAAAGEGEEDRRDPYFLLGVRPPGSKAMEPSVSTQVEEKPKERKKIQFAMSSEDEDEPKERKIHFNMPASVPSNLDPRQVEMAALQGWEQVSGRQRQHGAPGPHTSPRERWALWMFPASKERNREIRRRRPTPATLFRVADHSSPEDDQSTHQWVVGENGVLKPKRVNPNVYQPPSLRGFLNQHLI
ncbi:Protein phosphatase 1 regulatory subunit 1B, partial [Dissostichus eleginoides]